MNYLHLRKILIIIWLQMIVCLSLSGTTYYISPGGKDSNPGTITQPFFTLKKAWTVIFAGDIVYLRGGIYYYPTSQELNGKNGTAANPIKIWAYPGESPVITKSGSWTYFNRAGIYFVGDYFYWKGITVSGFNQVDDNIYYSMIIQNANHNIIEQMTFSYSSLGFDLSHYSTDNLILDCDFHHNYDPLTSSDPYGNADGANAHTDYGTTNTFKECRFWYNSDDGIDLYNGDGLIVLDGCWSWMNGYREDGTTKGGDGYGFKLGRTSTDYSFIHLRTFTNCISFYNRLGGYSINMAKCIAWMFNNVAYHNNDGTDFSLGFAFDDHNGIVHKLRNNIGYANQNTYGIEANWTAESTEDHNSWDNGITVTNSDFLSTDSSGVSGTRGLSGNLPDLNFLKLAEGSDLIDAGVYVGLSYDGDAPDIGAFETQSDLPPLAPVYVSSAVENAAPSLLTMTFDLALNNSTVPGTSSFNVLVNSITIAINSISISGNKVQLSLSSPITIGDIVTVSYLKPSQNTLQTISGGEATSLSNKSVTNNCQKAGTYDEPPVIIIKSPKTTFAGFVSEIDASSTYDPDNDPLIIDWSVPNNVPVSNLNNSKTQFLAPIVKSTVVIDFQLNVSDGISLLTNDVTIDVLPYKPELAEAKITNIEASNFQPSGNPDNVVDGNNETCWSSKGDNQWLMMELASPYKISHVELGFLHGQQYESYFDIYASKDNITWVPVLTKVASANFTGENQIFVFPDLNANTDYSYVKYVGRGNSVNSWNNVSEVKFFGSPLPKQSPVDTAKTSIRIYPNPASDYINISIGESTRLPDKIRIIDYSGKNVFEKPIDPKIKNLQIPISIKSGLYIVNLYIGFVNIYSQKLIIK